jgi:hypothetical protein
MAAKRCTLSAVARPQPLVPTNTTDVVSRMVFTAHAIRADVGVRRNIGGYRSIRTWAQMKPPESRTLLQPTLCKFGFGSVQVNTGFESMQVLVGGKDEKSIPHVIWLGFNFWNNDFRISATNWAQTTVKYVETVTNIPANSYHRRHKICALWPRRLNMIATVANIGPHIKFGSQVIKTQIRPPPVSSVNIIIFKPSAGKKRAPIQQHIKRDVGWYLPSIYSSSHSCINFGTSGQSWTSTSSSSLPPLQAITL